MLQIMSSHKELWCSIGSALRFMSLRMLTDLSVLSDRTTSRRPLRQQFSICLPSLWIEQKSFRKAANFNLKVTCSIPLWGKSYVYPDYLPKGQSGPMFVVFKILNITKIIARPRARGEGADHHGIWQQLELQAPLKNQSFTLSQCHTKYIIYFTQ